MGMKKFRGRWCSLILQHTTTVSLPLHLTIPRQKNQTRIIHPGPYSMTSSQHSGIRNAKTITQLPIQTPFMRSFIFLSSLILIPLLFSPLSSQSYMLSTIYRYQLIFSDIASSIFHNRTLYRYSLMTYLLFNFTFFFVIFPMFRL